MPCTLLIILFQVPLGIIDANGTSVAGMCEAVEEVVEKYVPKIKDEQGKVRNKLHYFS